MASEPQMATVDGNEAVAAVAHRLSEVVAVYPITPSSTMGELADEWAAHGVPNVWGTVPRVVEMQSEAGAAGAVHGALQGGALATTFTASQGLLLMIPNLYKIAGELTSFCMHVSARTVATHALSIFGDHSDVMACRQTGVAMLASGGVQEAQDLAAIAHAATLRARVPFLHFFDGFRTSHEVAKIAPLSDDVLRALVDDELVAAHRRRALTPDRPVIRGTAQNPDTFFQAREAANPFYLACPRLVRETMERFAELTGRRYGLFDYVGHPEAERVVVVMGSAAETTHETVDWLLARGEKVGVLKVRLYRPFALEDFAAALPASVRAIAVLDRTKEPGALGEPLYQDVVAALREAGRDVPVVIGGRYGLSSKEFTPAMARAVFDELADPAPERHFTVGIVDDVTGLSLPVDGELDIEPDDVVRAVFFGLGADGTVGANKNSIKIIGEETPSWVQGYFVYDSKKSGAVTVSHLRFGPRPIRSAYLVARAGFVACHQESLLERYDVLATAMPGAVFLLNSHHGPDAVWDHLPPDVQATILEKKLQLWVIDASTVAAEAGLDGRINVIMQTCFFAISGVLPREDAIRAIKRAVARSYARKGKDVVQKNLAVVDEALGHLHRVEVAGRVAAIDGRRPLVGADAPDFVRRVTAAILAGKGDTLPVSAFPVDGTWPLGTARWEKRNIAREIPVWDPAICIQCNKCVLVCPHSAIRAKVYAPELRGGAPPTFKSTPYRGHEFPGPHEYALQVAPEDCTGCEICVTVCPVKDKTDPAHRAIDMHPQHGLRAPEAANWDFFLGLPDPPREQVRLDPKGVEFLEPLFEFSGACSGCGETPYVRLVTQLFGDRALIANATGCSSIFGGNLPTTPYRANRDGRGPAWSNSLFEDNAEFGLGLRLAADTHAGHARALVKALAPRLGDELVRRLLDGDETTEAAVAARRAAITALRERLPALEGPEARRLEQLADWLVRKSVWIVGGDGWAYDIGFGGLDHVLALGSDVNLLVLDTEVYSNTGGQQSKATPRGATARFAAAGKTTPKKDLGMMAMSYGNVYVARVAFGARDAHTVRAFVEAESYPGPSLIIAYAHCIAHGFDLSQGVEHQKLAVASGYWPLYRFDPRRAAAGKSPLTLDGGPLKSKLADFMHEETRFAHADGAAAEAAREAASRLEVYTQLAKLAPGAPGSVARPARS